MNNQHVGSSLDALLREDGVLDEVMETACQRIKHYQALTSSPILDAVRETVAGFHGLGLVDNAEMKRFDELCLKPVAKSGKTKPGS